MDRSRGSRRRGLGQPRPLLAVRWRTSEN